MAYTEEIIQRVWEKARADGDHDPDQWRRDECGAWIGRGHYANRESEFGWDIYHIPPGDSADTARLHAVHWRNNPHGHPGPPHCRVTADVGGIANRDHD